MVDELDVERAGQDLERSGEPYIIRARPGVARGVIMDQQQRSGAVVQGFLHKQTVPAIELACSPDGDDVVANVRALRVERNHQQHFVVERPEPLV